MTDNNMRHPEQAENSSRPGNAEQKDNRREPRPTQEINQMQDDEVADEKMEAENNRENNSANSQFQ